VGAAAERKNMRTPSISAEQAQRAWYVVDANGKVLGRLAS